MSAFDRNELISYTAKSRDVISLVFIGQIFLKIGFTVEPRLLQTLTT